MSAAPMPHQVRPARQDDDAAVQGLFERAIRGAAWLPAGADADTDFKRNSSCEVVTVCVAADGRLAGFMAVYEPGAFVHHLYVDEGFKQQGVGRALIASLDAWPDKPWRLKCVLGNSAARAFYARMGWRETEIAMGSQGQYVVLRR
jgi:GNAT superfamily N-acetyltransferase